VVSEKKVQKFKHNKTLPCHELPLTNCAFNKNGDKFLTGSYDQTCIIWETETGKILHKLKGHKNVVYAISFNLPYGDKVATGSFDSTAKVNKKTNI
jgi:dynein assembly factor with WDR repeat domains 1